jgi:integrase
VGYVNREVIRKDKVEIYQREGESPRWYAKLRIGRKITKRLSLGTTDRDEAERIALDQYQELEFKHGKGLSLSPKRFSKVAEDFLSHYEQQVDIKESVPSAKQMNLKKFSRNQLQKKSYIIQKYLIPFFESKSIQGITEHDIEDYVSNRLTYWITGKGAKIDSITYTRNGRKITRPKNAAEKSPPSYSTINKELTCLRAIFGFASKKRLISASEIPSIENITKPDGYDEEHETPSFTEQEMKKLLNAIGKKFQEQKNPKHKLAHRRLGLYIAIMASSGMRTSDAKNLKFTDCKVFKKGSKQYFSIFVGSKGKQRELVPLKECKNLIDRMKKYHQKNAKQFGWEYSDSMFMFSNENGVPIDSFTTALDRALKDCDLLFTNDGRKRSSRSFRSFYITSALLEGSMTMEQLAGNVGNSPDVIWQHYNRMKSNQIPEKFQFKSVMSGLFT